eukprot:COSAG02_NODE_586_length_19960_cov_13.442118_5_plen_62_part_00
MSAVCFQLISGKWVHLDDEKGGELFSYEQNAVAFPLLMSGSVVASLSSQGLGQGEIMNTGA